MCLIPKITKIFGSFWAATGMNGLTNWVWYVSKLGHAISVSGSMCIIYWWQSDKVRNITYIYISVIIKGFAVFRIVLFLSKCEKSKWFVWQFLVVVIFLLRSLYYKRYMTVCRDVACVQQVGSEGEHPACKPGT